ncbi:hypothetical protein A0J61_09415 [Choanephora cucurbitarum]|uniref:Uncharacterized protein n=1 Tax=Choanephora cucurbitarum TaxID=101091 RepID=A0A1C7N1G2_9FUNG|nr:hypothetical protein A0J61_09415 [Choanephora cucurbitarum]
MTNQDHVKHTRAFGSNLNTNRVILPIEEKNAVGVIGKFSSLVNDYTPIGTEVLNDQEIKLSQQH